MADEPDILQRLRAGDPHAFKDVVDAYSPRVYRLALSMLRDPDEAEDVLQETFLSVYRGLGTFRGDSGLGTWIYRIATNASLMRLRRRRRDAAYLQEPPDDGSDLAVTPPVADWAWDPERAALTGEIRQVMDEAVGELSEGLRLVFLLRDVEGLSTAEVADTLGLTEAAVKSRLHRARLFLRDRLSDYFAPAEGKQ